MFEGPSPEIVIVDEAAEGCLVWDEVIRAWLDRPSARRYDRRFTRYADDFWRSQEAAFTRRTVQVSTRKYKARRKRK